MRGNIFLEMAENMKMGYAGDDWHVFIAYGSNLLPGNLTASQSFAEVVKALEGRGLLITKISRLWRSRAWPNPQDPDYVNAVLLVETELSARSLLTVLHEVERDFGRVRDGRRNAPRAVDLDLIAYGDEVADEDGLVVPHPRAHERAFVMGPLAEIVPEWRHPLTGKTVQDLFKSAVVGSDAYPLDAAL